MSLPPGFVWSPLVPELLVTRLPDSLRFWCGLIGFAIVYQRPEDGFACLDRGGAQVMLEEAFRPGRKWIAAPLRRPCGRGVNLELAVADLDVVLSRLAAAGWPLFMAREDRW